MKYYPWFFVLLLIPSCKEDCNEPITEEPYDIIVQQFYLLDGGDPEKGYCGNAIVAADTNLINIAYYKPIDIPAGIEPGYKFEYKGKFRVFPEKHSCKDGWGDPRPGEAPKTKQMNFITILEWEKL